MWLSSTSTRNSKSIEMSAVNYERTHDAHCPITYKPLLELSCPVAFRDTPQHPYECDDLLRWLKTKPTNPMTNKEVDHCQPSFLEAIGPLAGIADQGPAITKPSGDTQKMTADSICWTLLVCHAALFVLVAADLLLFLAQEEFCGAGDVWTVIFAMGHWGWNAWHSYRKRQLAVVAALMLCAGMTNVSLYDVCVFV